MKTYELYATEKGEWTEQDTSMTGAMYSDMHINNGAFRAILDYNLAAGNDGPIIEQEDGAPGHGFNNKAPGVNGLPGQPTVTHAQLEEIGKEYMALSSSSNLLTLLR
jgi:hypothetical protein